MDFREDRVSDDRAELALESGGGIVVERDPARATYTVPFPLDDADLVHPYLGSAAAIVAYWVGREIFHAGGFVAGDGAWAVLGEREAGKSSLLAWLAHVGQPVLSDDIVVVEDGHAYAGPRSIDLRETAAEALETGMPLGVVGARERWRLELEQVAPSAPLVGWIFLSWGPELMLERLRGGEVLTRIAAQRAVRLPPAEPATLLRLSGLPAWELRRPQSWHLLEPAGELLLERLSSPPARATRPEAR